MFLLLRLLLTLFCSLARKLSCFSSSGSSSAFFAASASAASSASLLLQPLGLLLSIGDNSLYHLRQRSPMAAALMLQPHRAWCATIFFNPSKRLLEGNLWDASCCKGCSFSGMRRLVPCDRSQPEMPRKLVSLVIVARPRKKNWMSALAGCPHSSARFNLLGEDGGVMLDELGHHVTIILPTHGQMSHVK